MVLAANMRAAFGMTINVSNSACTENFLHVVDLRVQDCFQVPIQWELNVKLWGGEKSTIWRIFRRSSGTKSRGVPGTGNAGGGGRETPRQGWEPSAAASTCTKPLKPCASRHHLHGSFLFPFFFPPSFFFFPLFPNPNQCCLGH